MKTALCVSGQPRTMEYCFPSIKKHLIDVYNPDIFICSDDQEKKITELYRPKNMERYSQDEIDRHIFHHFGELSYETCYTQPKKDLSYNWKVWRCGKMLEDEENKSGKYDVVMFTRFDIKFLKIPKIEYPESKTVYIPYTDALRVSADQNGRHFNGNSCQLGWGSSDVAHILFNYFLETPDLYSRLGHWQAEEMFRALCDKYGISTQMVDITMMIIRGEPGNWLSTDLRPLSEFPDFYGAE